MRYLLIALAAITAPCVSCFPPSFPVSLACNASSAAIDNNTTVSLAESFVVRSGCLRLDYNDITRPGNTDSQCSYDVKEGGYACYCETQLVNSTGWESAVRDISLSGQACYISYTVTLDGNESRNNRNRTVTLSATHTNYDFMAFGKYCNTTEIQTVLEGDLTTILGNLEYSSLNANSSVTGATWTSATVVVTACGASSDASKALIPSSTTAAPTTPNTNTTSTTSSLSGFSSISNSNATTSLPPVTPSPSLNSSSSSSSSSTGGRGTGTGSGTGTPPGNGASVMMHSATAVMVALICATVM